MRITDCDEGVFPDNVYGQILVPKLLINAVIDTTLFQRLRSIEQTGGSMRALYPTARHDRFSHSLGVFHLGKRAFETLREQYGKSEFKKADSKSFTPFGDDKWWDKHLLIFMAACLLHDCAHAPFSHTFEPYYKLEMVPFAPEGRVEKIEGISGCEARLFPMQRLDYEMLEAYGVEDDLGFADDYILSRSTHGGGCGSPHERMSALVVKTYFFDRLREAARKLGFDFDEKDCQAIARMIIGCPYSKMLTPELSLLNCMISLLNSDIVDVDKLDYIIRDTTTSGMRNWDVDYEAILKSLTVCVAEAYNESIDDMRMDLHVWQQGAVFEIDTENRESAISIFGKFEIELADDAKANGLSEQYGLKQSGNRAICTNPKGVSEPLRFEKNDVGCAKITLAGNCLVGIDSLTGSIRGTLLNGAIGFEEPSRLRFFLAYGDASINAIISAMEARNSFHRWAYVNPHVLYNASFLKRFMFKWSAKYLCCEKYNDAFRDNSEYPLRNCRSCPAKTVEAEEGPVSVEDIMMAILGLEGFYHPGLVEELCNQNAFGAYWCSNDDDMQALFKRIYLENKMRGPGKNELIDQYFGEYFSRKTKKPIWSSFADFKKCCLLQNAVMPRYSELSETADTSLDKDYFLYGLSSSSTLQELLPDGCDLQKAVIVKASANVRCVDSASVMIAFPDQSVLRLCDVSDIVPYEEKPDFYYIFC